MTMLRQFRLTVAGPLDDERADLLFGRADDLSVEVVPADGVAWVAFDRVAPTLVDAVVSGVRDLDAAGVGIDRAVADDPLVTLEVIAARIGRPVAAGRGFPAPVRDHPRRPVYSWPDVLAWLDRRRASVPPGGDAEATLEAVTLALRLRALAPRLERMPPIRSLLYP
ncbi:hypothetical protein OHA72_15820 [Dactylosporangium sp. NBC_01737]|uniref:helix-turn-helix transcriptional regulator n=1 Tax=Dactylosporangium sp. NBC_01737 TaxID=2975959 RepID=UPI002E104BDA|nr:hypothetical protein OHA72_15820 [Dactylosporangium sp. NBC_01737]